jgi:hypothetical protein
MGMFISMDQLDRWIAKARQKKDQGMIPTSGTAESSETDVRTQYKRLCELDSDAENGWMEEERHIFSLVRVPNNFLKAVQLQVRCGHGERSAEELSPPNIYTIYQWYGPSLVVLHDMKHPARADYLCGLWDT